MRHRSVEDVPIAHTPPGGYGEEMPEPILAGCDEPIIRGAPDLRGTWRVTSIEADGTAITEHPLTGSIQRIEQHADRLVVTGGGIVHDMRCDGSEAHGVHDVMAIDFATPVDVVATYEQGIHVLRPVGTAIEVRRWREGDEMVWDYLGLTARLEMVEPTPGKG